MGLPLNRAHRVDAGDAAALAQRFEAFASSLPEQERTILFAMVERAMPPLDRLALRDPAEVLSEEELKALGELLAQGERGP